MELTGGVKKYLDDLVSNDSIFLVLIYGSSVTKRSNDMSDLDIFVLGIFESDHRKAITIDDVELEINFTDIGAIENHIENSIKENNSYYESVFNNNIVLKDSNSLVDKYRNYIKMIKSAIKKKPRKMLLRNQYMLHSLYECLKSFEDLYSYFNFIDSIRMTYAYMYNYSTLNVGKVYEMYSDPKHAAHDYCLDLPPKEFISHFDHSIRDPLNKNEINWLMDSIGFDPLSCMRDCGFFKYVDVQRRKSILIHINKMVNRTIKMIVEKNPYKDYVYHVIVNHIYRFYEEIYGNVTEEFIEVFNLAKKENDGLLQIEYLNQLFSLLEGKYAFDYKNYTLYFD